MVIQGEGAEAIKKMIEWNDPVDVNSIKAFLCEDKHDDDLHDAIIEEKRGRIIHEEDVELGSKKRSPSNKEAYKEQKLVKVPSFAYLEDISIPKERWEKDKEKEKDDTWKSKVEAIMVEALDTHLMKEEEEKIGQVFTFMCDLVINDGYKTEQEINSSEAQEEKVEEIEEFFNGKIENEIL